MFLFKNIKYKAVFDYTLRIFPEAAKKNVLWI